MELPHLISGSTTSDPDFALLYGLTYILLFNTVSFFLFLFFKSLGNLKQVGTELFWCFAARLTPKVEPTTTSLTQPYHDVSNPDPHG